MDHIWSTYKFSNFLGGYLNIDCFQQVPTGDTTASSSMPPDGYLNHLKLKGDDKVRFSCLAVKYLEGGRNRPGYQ